jgi:stress response protein YsnF
VREEIRVRRRSVTETRDLTETIRRERVSFDEQPISADDTTETAAP